MSAGTLLSRYVKVFWSIKKCREMSRNVKMCDLTVKIIFLYEVLSREICPKEICQLHLLMFGFIMQLKSSFHVKGRNEKRSSEISERNNIYFSISVNYVMTRNYVLQENAPRAKMPGGLAWEKDVERLQTQWIPNLSDFTLPSYLCGHLLLGEWSSKQEFCKLMYNRFFKVI